MRGITHSYSGMYALREVDLELIAGQIRALIGQNGAGKSTLVRVLVGAVSPDHGTVYMDDAELSFSSPADARIKGIAAVHQDVQLFPDLDVAANVYAVDHRLPRRSRSRMIDWRVVQQRTSSFLRELGIDLEPRRQVRELSIAERKLVQIARAVAMQPKVLILDEPTASLERRASRAVLDLMDRLRAAGLGICFVSHRLDEVRTVSDTITVLRDGRIVGTVAGGAREEKLIELMLGREASDVAPSRVADKRGVALSVRGLRLTPARNAIEFDVAGGEIVGLTGVMGSGVEDVARMLGGIQACRGDVVVGGIAVEIRQPANALRAGIAFVPEDRHRHGIFAMLDVSQNIVMASLQRIAKRGFLRRRSMDALAETFVKQLGVRTASLNTSAGSLSGGNQQKLLVARCLAAGAKVLVLHEPTHGVDVGAIRQIHALLREFAEQGGAIIVASGEVRELVKLCDRILVLRDSELVHTLSPERHDVSDVMLASVREVAVLDSLIEGERQ